MSGDLAAALCQRDLMARTRDAERIIAARVEAASGCGVSDKRPVYFGYLPECPDGTDCTRPGCLDAHMWRCQHHWLDRPKSDTRECLICGTEVAG